MIKVGDRIPNAEFILLTNESFEKIRLEDQLKGKKIVLFGFPGAFTGTCALEHVPSFVAMADQLKAKGVDGIFGTSVNDAMVEKAFGEAQGAVGKVMLLPDWDASFAKAMGMDIDMSPYGMGTRSLRYSLVAIDGVVTHLDVEENPAVCSVTKADEILKYL